MISIKDIPSLQSVKPLVGYKLELTYSNGYKGVYDVNGLLQYEVFSPLKDEKLFNKVQKNHNAVVWNDEIDLCGDALYLKITGETLADA
jgi:uncharacterized protein DUF2442